MSSSVAAGCTTRSNQVSKRQRAEQAQQIELALAHQRQRRGDATRRERGVGVREEQVVGVGCAARARHARVQRMDLAGPIGRTGVDLDDLEAPVVGDFCAGERRGVVGAAIEREHDSRCPDTFRRAGTARDSAMTRDSLCAGTTTQTRPVGGSSRGEPLADTQASARRASLARPSSTRAPRRRSSRPRRHRGTSRR